MSTSDERFEEVKTNYVNALLSERDDISRATSAGDVSKIQVNVAQAAVAFYETAADRLSAQSASAEQAYKAAVTANEAVVRARQTAMAIAQLIGLLTQATNAANSLVKQATV